MFTVKELQSDLSDIFVKAKRRSQANFYLSLLHIVDSSEFRALFHNSNPTPVPSTFRFNFTPKSLHSITNLTAYTDYLESKSDNPEFLTMYAKLYAYLQSLETKYTYKVIGNLLRVLLNQNPDSELYDALHSGYQCYTNIISLHNQLIATDTRFAIFAKWDSFMNRSLRNAIAHNDIFIHSDKRELLIPSVLLRSLVRPNEAEKPVGSYSFDTINEYYRNATNFSEAFKRSVIHYIDLGDRY